MPTRAYEMKESLQEERAHTSAQVSRFSLVNAPTAGAFVLPAKEMTFSICASSSAAESSRPVLSASGTLKNLFFRTKTTWLWDAGSNL